MRGISLVVLAFAIGACSSTSSGTGSSNGNSSAATPSSSAVGGNVPGDSSDPCGGVVCGYHGTCDPSYRQCRGCDWVPQSGSSGSCVDSHGFCIDHGPGYPKGPSVAGDCATPYDDAAGFGYSDKSCKDLLPGRAVVGYCDLAGNALVSPVCDPSFNRTETYYACEDGGTTICTADPQPVCTALGGKWRTK